MPMDGMPPGLSHARTDLLLDHGQSGVGRAIKSRERSRPPDENTASVIPLSATSWCRLAKLRRYWRVDRREPPRLRVCPSGRSQDVHRSIVDPADGGQLLVAPQAISRHPNTIPMAKTPPESVCQRADRGCLGRKRACAFSSID